VKFKEKIRRRRKKDKKEIYIIYIIIYLCDFELEKKRAKEREKFEKA
jgi:hypothetical protein